jgi:hypothetical protein
VPIVELVVHSELYVIVRGYVFYCVHEVIALTISFRLRQKHVIRLIHVELRMIVQVVHGR